MSMMSGSNLVAREAGLRVPAASQMGERSRRLRVVKPRAKASGRSAARATKEDAVTFEGTGPKSPGLLRRTSKSEHGP